MRITEESSARYLIKKGWLNKPLFYSVILCIYFSNKT
jgi:hypothetical protein